MRTEHALYAGDAADLALPDGAVDLVVTSPPYPMIEMWDELFARRDPAVGEALSAGDAAAAFEGMHAQLDAVWEEVARVLAPGGVACVNVGDATRTVGGRFRQFPNHARVLEALVDRGLTPLPDVLWRKPTNSATKFLGSGTLPPNAYVTLEHEYVLVVRKGGPREFEPGDRRRYESAFFWEERNRWFSDLWEFTGTGQAVAGDGSVPGDEAGEGAVDGAGEGAAGREAADVDPGTRERAGAFPLAVPLRLVRMYSVYGDTVLDPFVGTGTTTLAAMLAGRDSVGYDLDAGLLTAVEDRLAGLPGRSRTEVQDRLARHRAFLAEREEPPAHEAVHYDFRVVTEQERRIRLYAVDGVERADDRGGDGDDDPTGDSRHGGSDDPPESGGPYRRYRVEHVPVEDDGPGN